MPVGYAGPGPVPPSLPIDYNTVAHWQRIKDAGIDTMFCPAYFSQFSPVDKTANESAIASSTAANVALLVTDNAVYQRYVRNIGEYEYWDSVLPAYAADSRVKGFYLRDEPAYAEIEGLANAYRRIKEYNPNWRVHVNLALSPWDPNYQATTDNPIAVSSVYSTGWGTYVTSYRPLGQTITIPKGIAKITEIELYLDKAQWTAGEVLTITLWDSAAKQTSYGQATLTGTSDFFPHFVFPGGAPVPPNNTAYFELTHSGGGDNSVGWVLHSQYDTYKAGTGYQAGVAQYTDFYFRVYGQRVNTGDIYENLIDDWVDLSGADHIQSTTFYPLYNGDTLGMYFTGLERLRGRGLAHDLPYGVYLQSVPLAGDPSAAMMRWNAYTALTYGARQLNWFTYWTPIADPGGRDWPTAVVSEDGTPSAKYDIIKALNSELHVFGTVLKDTTSKRVFHTGATLPTGVRALPGAFFVRPSDVSWPLTIGYFTGSNGEKYLMVTNRDYNNPLVGSLRFDDGPSTVREVDRATGSIAPAAGYSRSKLPLVLNPGDARLYSLSDDYANMAAMAKVTASSSLESTRVGYGLDKVNDDIRTSIDKNLGWSSSSLLSTNHTEWVQFDLGYLGPQISISEVNLYPLSYGLFFPNTYAVETSVDGSTWTTRCNPTLTGAPEVQTCKFTRSAARYVRIKGTNLPSVNGEYRMQLGEVEIYTRSDYAFGRTIRASSSVESPPAWGIEAVHDRQRSMVASPFGSGWGWSSSSNLGQNHTEWLEIDLEGNKPIWTVILCPRNSPGYEGSGFPIDFTIKTAPENGDWVTQVTKTGYPKPDHVCLPFSFNSTNASRVRIEGTNLRQIWSEYRMQFAEIYVY